MRAVHRSYLAAILLIVVVSTIHAGGQGEVRGDDPAGTEGPPGIDGVDDPAELIATARGLVEQQRYDDAVPYLTAAARIDEEQLPAVEVIFEKIRRARIAYEQKGREVEARLRELIDSDIPPDQVVPTAFQALRLIGEMNDIFPYPNTEDLQLIEELQSRVLLTIDRRRFESLMDAALARLEDGDTVRAVGIYVDGLGEYGFEVGAGTTQESTQAQDAAIEQGEAQIEALLETDGIAIQIGSFNPQDYPLTGEQFSAARETIRRVTIGRDGDEGVPTFVDVAIPAEDQAREMMASFASGDFEDARGQIQDYLPLLEQTTRVYRAAVAAAEVVAEQEATNALRAVQDAGYRYNWHIRFVNDIVFGRPVADGSGDRRREGVLEAVEAVWDLVANGPVDATRAFGAERYALAIDELQRFPWSGVDSPEDDARVRAHVADTTATLETVAVSYRTTIDILNVARALGLMIPGPSNQPTAPGFVPVVPRVADVPDPALASTLLEAMAHVASSEDLEATIESAFNAFDEATPLASRSSVAPLDRQRASLRSRLEELYAQEDRWRAFAEALTTLNDDDAGDAGDAGVAATSAHPLYIADRIGQVRSYELDVVRQVADIETRAINSRLSSYESTVASARRDLDATDPVSTAPRPRAAEARDRLRPLVGTVVGSRVTTTASGDLQELRDDAQEIAIRLRADENYIALDPQIRQFVSRNDAVAATVGSSATGLLAEARRLLEQALEQITQAEALEERALDAVAEIGALIDEAESENDAGNVLQASVLLDDAEDLLSSNSASDASTLFTASLESWYRPEVESRWDEVRTALSDRLNDARREIVLARVDILAQQAEPLIDPPPGEEARPGEAILLLEEAEALWTSVYPLVQNPAITPLLRRARILESQQQQELTEDVPGFARLSQILNTARTAFERQNFETAQQALDFFLVEQPLNAEARLLDIRLELATGQGSADAIVRSYVTRSLDEVTETPGDSASVESQIVTAARQLRTTDGRSGSVSDAVFNGLLPLRSKLNAIRQIVELQGGVNQANVNRISGLIADINTNLDPPVPPEPRPIDRQRIVDEIIETQLARGNWPNLPVEQQVEVYQELVRARTILPGDDRTNQLIAVIQSYLPTVRTPNATEQAIMTQANRLVQQGDLNGALATLEDYMNTADEDPMLIPQWRSLYNDLIRRLRRQ